jgi:hypothetical protein
VKAESSRGSILEGIHRIDCALDVNTAQRHVRLLLFEIILTSSPHRHHIIMVLEEDRTAASLGLGSLSFLDTRPYLWKGG